MTSAGDLVLEIGSAVEFRVGGEAMVLRPKERAVLGGIVVRHPEPALVDELIESVWGHEPPRSAHSSLHNHLARVREVAPTVVERTRSGYRLSFDLRVELDGDEVDVRTLLGLADVPATRTACAVFVERWRDTRDGFTAAIRRGAADSIIDRLATDTTEDPTDERRWWRLMIAHAVAGRWPEVRRAHESLRRHLSDVGLEPSRRIADVVRLAEHDVRDPAAYLNDPFGGPVDQLVHRDSAFRPHVEEVRSTIVQSRHRTIDVCGPADHRREVLRRVVDAVRLDGIDASIVSCTPQMVAAPDPATDRERDRPALIVLDGVDHLADPEHATERARSSMRPGDPLSVVVVRGRDQPGADADATVRIVPAPASTANQERRSTHVRSDSTLSDVVSTLSVLDEPVAPELLGQLVESDAIERAIRIGIVHHDHANDRVIARVPGDRRASEQSTRAEIIDRVLPLDLGDSPLAAASRRLRLLIERFALVVDAESAAEFAERLRTTAFDTAREANRTATPATAAAALRRAFAAIDDRADLRHSDVWFDLAIGAGQAEHALASPAGPDLLRDAVLAAHGRGDDARAAEALLELARLGPVATAGSADADALELFELLDTSDPDPSLGGAAVAARVGAAGAMILSFAGQPERLRSVYERAEAAARRCGDRELIEVLPLSFMSLPLPDDLDRRRAIAVDLTTASEREDDAAGRWEALHLSVAHAVMDGDPRFRRLTDEIASVSATLPEQSRRWEGAYLDANRHLIDGDLDAARAAGVRQLETAGNVHPDRVAAVYGATEMAIALAGGTEAELAPVTADLAAAQPDIGAWQAALAACAASAGDSDTARSAISRCLDEDVLAVDHTYTVALLALGHAAVALGEPRVARRVFERLVRYSGTWTWCGSTTFGPVDLTLARLARLLDEPRAPALATAAIRTTALMSAPIWNRSAIDALLDGDA